ncbi:hypothetical protein VTK73DRAFT_2087 [Phialemonium thermophilum]|uniref:AB hydrolase-1 domain-containing protein n=1 Tax=Phialemonium thermophilum TaxID=223376 RepID=A0ABR3X6M8_9PEZI
MSSKTSSSRTAPGSLPPALPISKSIPIAQRVIVVALFGNGESSSPSNALGFPKTVDYRDCVHAQHKLITSHLKIASIDVVVGFSMGGQCAYYWTLMYPNLVRNAVIICSSARTSRHNYQFLEGPKAALQNAIDYVDKDRMSAVPPSTVSRGVHAFGKAYSAWLTSSEWFEQQAYRSIGYPTLGDWDRATTEANYVGWHPDDLLAMLHMWQNGDIATLVGSDHRDSEDDPLRKALSQVRARVLLLPCQTDQYFRWEASKREAEWLPNGTFKVIPSIWGHIAGGGSNETDNKWLDQAIAEFLHMQT